MNNSDKSLEKLLSLKQEGKVDFIFVDALPRTKSTAIEQIIAHHPAVDMQLHEPFSLPFNKAMDWIYGQVEPEVNRRSDEERPDYPVRIVIKCMADRIDRLSKQDPDSYNSLLQLFSNYITVIRNPSDQLKSYYKLAISKHCSNESYDLVSPASYESMIQWGKLRDNADRAREAGVNHAVLDIDSLEKEPAKVVASLFENIGLSSDESSVYESLNNWGRNGGKNFRQPDIDGWAEDTRFSTAYQCDGAARSKPDFPPNARAFLSEIAEKAYAELLNLSLQDSRLVRA